eukprot:Rhum_TRINITY_DN9894_c0_g1::Rhum_TRINITY_DN9894_c0_g1_i1::g.35730::m.35730
MLCCAATPGSTSRHPSSAVTSASALWYTIARMSSGEWIRKFCGVPTASTGGVFSVNVCVPPCASCWMICGSLIGSHFDGSARSAASGSVLPYTVTRMGRGDRQPTENAVTRAITVDCRRNEKPYSSYLAFGGVTRLASTRLPPSPPPPPPSRRSLSMRCSRPSRSSVTRARSSLSNAASSLASATGCRRYCHTCAVVKPSGRTKIDSREFSVAIRATVPMRHSECVLSRNSTREPCCRPSVWCSFATASLNSASPNASPSSAACSSASLAWSVSKGCGTRRCMAASYSSCEMAPRSFAAFRASILAASCDVSRSSPARRNISRRPSPASTTRCRPSSSSFEASRSTRRSLIVQWGGGDGGGAMKYRYCSF